jgi:hypothetical protein
VDRPGLRPAQPREPIGRDHQLRSFPFDFRAGRSPLREGGRLTFIAPASSTGPNEKRSLRSSPSRAAGAAGRIADYNRTLQLFNRGAAAAQDVRNAQGKVDTAAIALNTAKYAEATCQNHAANPANKDCVNLALELNRLIDELAITQDQEAIAKANYDAATILFNKNAISAQEYQQIKTAYDTAKLQTQLIQQQITDQRAKTTAANCKNVDRPAPPPTSTTPAPTSTTPAPTSTTPVPTSTTTSPTPITSSPIPVSTTGF